MAGFRDNLVDFNDGLSDFLDSTSTTFNGDTTFITDLRTDMRAERDAAKATRTEMPSE